jgi:hypothetical protein
MVVSEFGNAVEAVPEFSNAQNVVKITMTMTATTQETAKSGFRSRTPFLESTARALSRVSIRSGLLEPVDLPIRE